MAADKESDRPATHEGFLARLRAATGQPLAAGDAFGESFLLTRLSDAVQWARKYSFFPYPYVTACCGMEYFSAAGPRFDIDRFGAALPRFTPRQSDLLMVVGTITHRLAPVLRRVWEQMAEPEMGGVVRRLHLVGRPVQQLRRGARHRHHHPGASLHPGVSAASGSGAGRPDQIAEAGAGGTRGETAARDPRQRATHRGLTDYADDHH